MEGIEDGPIAAMLAHVVLVAVAGLELDPEGAGHQGEEGIADVEIEQVAAPFIGHQQQAALIQLPKILNRLAWRAVVLGQNAQLPAAALLKAIQFAFQAAALAIREVVGQIDHGCGVVGQQVGVVVGPGRCPGR